MKSGSTEPPAFVSAREPLHLYIGREVLEAVIEDNLANIRNNREVMIDLIGPEPAEEARLRDRIVKDRERFLEWVRAYPEVNVLVALHPLDAKALAE